MKKNFIIYIFIIFLLSSFNLFAEREVDIDKIKYDYNPEFIFALEYTQIIIEVMDEKNE